MSQNFWGNLCTRRDLRVDLVVSYKSDQCHVNVPNYSSTKPWLGVGTCHQVELSSVSPDKAHT